LLVPGEGAGQTNGHPDGPDTGSSGVRRPHRPRPGLSGAKREATMPELNRLVRQPSVPVLVLAVAGLAILTPSVFAAGPDAVTLKEVQLPPLVWVLPFVAMLLCIAVLPLLPHTQHWWESNWAKLVVSVALALVTAAYYLFRPFGMFHGDPLGQK